MKKALKVEIVDGELVISIGISTLCFAIDHSPEMWNEEEDKPRITDEAGFAHDILEQLTREEEDGTTPVHRMFDAAAARAIEYGSGNIEINE